MAKNNIAQYIKLQLGETEGEPLTPAEEKIVVLIMNGAITARQLAAKLHISPRTIRTHLVNIYKKLGVTNMPGLILKHTLPVIGDKVELRACNRMLGVLTPALTLEVKRGDLIITFDLVETLRQQRPVYTARPLPAYDKDTSIVPNDL